MQILYKEAFTVVGMQVEADWDALWTVMPQAWQNFFARHREIPHRANTVFMDISLGREAGRYTQLIAAEVTHVADLPPGMTKLEIPRQRYLHYRHVGPVREIASSFGKMHEWAAAHDVHLDDFMLDVGYTPSGEETTHDLYIRTPDTTA